MNNVAVTALAAAAGLVAATSAQAASLDLTPVINEAIAHILVPVLLAVVPTVGAILTLPVKRYLDQKSGSELALRVNDVLDKAIAFGAKKAEAWVGQEDFHATVDGTIATIAADYALQHAPDLMKKAGAAVSARAGEFAKDQAAAILQAKVVARLDSHPAVAAVKALAAAVAPTAPLAKAA